MGKSIIKMKVTIAEGLGKNLGAAVFKASREGMMEHCRILTEALRSNAPSDTGRLANSIIFDVHMTDDGAVGEVKMLKYGKVIEFGSDIRHLRARKWITQSIEQTDSRIAAEWENVIGETMREAARATPRKTREVTK